MCVDCNCKPLDPNYNLSACVRNQQRTSDTRTLNLSILSPRPDHYTINPIIIYIYIYIYIYIFWLNFLSKFEVNHLDHEKFGFWPWSWSRFRPFDQSYFEILAMVMVKNFDHVTMTPARRPYGQKIMVALPPGPPPLVYDFWLCFCYVSCSSMSRVTLIKT